MSAPTEQLSVVKALQHYFSEQPNGRKITIEEFKALSEQDKHDFVDLLRKQGYNVVDYVPAKPRT